MNIAIYYYDLPSVDDMLSVSVQMSLCPTAPVLEVNIRDIVEQWNGTEAYAFVVIGVSDEEIREIYKKATCRANEIESAVKEFADIYKKDCRVDIVLKRLYRFDTPASAGRYLSYLSFASQDAYCNKEDYEDFMQDRMGVLFHYEEPWVYARELTEDDWDPGGLFYEELSAHDEQY